MRLPRPSPLIGPGSYTVLFSRAEPPAGRSLTTAHTLQPEQPSKGKSSANSMNLNSSNSHFRGRVKGLRYTPTAWIENIILYYTDRTKHIYMTNTVKLHRDCKDNQTLLPGTEGWGERCTVHRRGWTEKLEEKQTLYEKRTRSQGAESLPGSKQLCSEFSAWLQRTCVTEDYISAW